MANYIPSENVTVFPSSLRSASNGDRASGKYTSEENLTGIIRTLANKDSFIINWGPKNTPATNTAEIVINGYYFKLLDCTAVPTTGNVYAGIKLDSAKRLKSLVTGTELDKQGNFVGLGFDTSASSFDYSLQILNNGTLVEANKHKFNADTIFLKSGSSIESLFNGSVLKVSQGGTGNTSFPVGNALIGNGSGNLSFVPTSNFFDGNAASATSATSANKLTTARTINGTSFNGESNITTANWGTSRNIGIVNSDGTATAVTVAVNGSANVNLKLPEDIKANLTGNVIGNVTGDLTGTASNATNATNATNADNISTDALASGSVALVGYTGTGYQRLKTTTVNVNSAGKMHVYGALEIDGATYWIVQLLFQEVQLLVILHLLIIDRLEILFSVLQLQVVLLAMLMVMFG